MRQTRRAHPADLPDAGTARAAREAKGFGPREFFRLLDAAHQQLGGSLVLVWDNDRRHLSRAMRTAIEVRSRWLTVFHLPAYAPELNPAEGLWANLKRGLANLAPRDTGQLATVIKTKLKPIQYRHGLLDSFITEIGLTPNRRNSRSSTSAAP
jgi:transposase